MKKYYAVAVGRKPGLYDEWFGDTGAEAQVKGQPNAVYKGFQSYSEAESWYKSRTQQEYVPRFLQQPMDVHSEDYFAIHQQALSEGKVVIYTDGGCEGNPGKGSYGTVLLLKDRRKELSGGFERTTNNRMEIMACIAGLQVLKQPASVVLFSDSAYVVNAMQDGWVQRWQQQQWQRKEGDQLVAVKNADLWQRLLELSNQHDVSFVKVLGHAGITENERCHQLVSLAMQRNDWPVDAEYQAADEKSSSVLHKRVRLGPTS